MANSKVCVIGIWHLGSVYSACLADLGYQVIGVDTDEKKVDNLNQGVAPVFEPGLNELIARNINSGRLSYISNLGCAVEGSCFVLLTFDTPVNDQDEIDLSQVFATARQMAQFLENGATVIVCSQVPIRTCDEIASTIRKANPSSSFGIAYSPENLRLGEAIASFMKPTRIVIGADSSDILDKVGRFFDVVKAPKVRMNLRTAEMTKHALNAFLATCISFSSEIANLCDELGADALRVVTALRSDDRIGARLPLLPGLGFSGGTLARDLKILKNLGDDLGYETDLIDGVLKVNERQNALVVKKLEKACGSIRGLRVGVLGLTYKAGTSTLRRSAALEIIKSLNAKGALIKAFDPKADLSEVHLNAEFEFCADPYAVAKGSDALLFLTDWLEFKKLDFDLIKSEMKKPLLIDAKNMLDCEQLIDKGFAYYGVGRGI